MKEWLDENPNGSKDAFETYFKALTPDIKKKYKDLALTAVCTLIHLCLMSTLS